MDDVAATTLAPPRARRRPVIAGRLARLGERAFGGHVLDPRDPARKLAVELLVDGIAVAVCRADQYDHGLRDRDDPCHGFRFVLDDIAIEPGTVVSARVANLDLAIGAPIVCAVMPPEPVTLPGLVRSAGGLRFTGWVASRDGDAWIAVAVDGQPVAEMRADGWTRPEPPADPAIAVPAFDFHLPERFADGRVHRLTAHNAAGEAVIGSPLAFVDFMDAVEAPADPAGFPGDRLSPRSLPMAEYERWHELHPLPPAETPTVEIAVILAGDGPAAVTLASLEAQTHPDWIAVAAPADAPAPAFDRETALAFLEGDGRDAAVVVFALAGSRLRPEALARLADALAHDPDAAVAYSDLEVAGADGRLWPLLFPAFDRERLLEQGYCAHFFALSGPVARRAVASGSGDLYALFHAAMMAKPAGAVIAVPGPLATLPRFDTAAAASVLAAASASYCRHAGGDAAAAPNGSPFFPAVRVLRRRRPGIGVAVIAPQVSEHTAACLAALEPALARASLTPIIVTANDAAPVEGATMVPAGADATRARLVNRAVAAVDGDFVCIIDDTIEVPADDWLDELAGRAAESDVGAVAPLVIGAEGLVRHAGAVLGPGFAIAPAFADATPGEPGHAGLLAVAHECAALEAGCILYRRNAFVAAGGMDETRFPRFFADADLCLRLRASGRLILVTPHARVIDRRTVITRDSPAAACELRAFRARWGEALLADPSYSPLLALDASPWSALAHPPRDAAPRRASLPPMADVPPGF
jgi:hypothetical protein